jgi:hypothetical protein
MTISPKDSIDVISLRSKNGNAGSEAQVTTLAGDADNGQRRRRQSAEEAAASIIGIV